MKHLMILSVILFLSGCKTEKVKGPLSSFTAEKENGTLWLVNSVSFGETGCDFHVTFMGLLQDSFATTWFSRFSLLDSTALQGMLSGLYPYHSKKNIFPAWMKIMDEDETGVYWTMSREHAYLFSKTSRMKGKDTTEIIVSSEWNYDFRRISDAEVKYFPEGQVSVIEPMIYKVKNSPREFPEANGRVFIRAFDDYNFLLQSGEWMWLDLVLENGRQFSVLSQIKPDGKDSLLILDDRSNSLQLASCALTHDPNKVWHSEETGKNYPLSFQLQTGQETFFIRPRLDNQEISQKKSSFWMGAVEVFTGNQEEASGYGNMYIFTH